MHGQHPSSPHAKLILYAYYGAYIALFNFAVGLQSLLNLTQLIYKLRIRSYACMHVSRENISTLDAT